MAEETPKMYAYFSSTWKIQWAEFEQLHLNDIPKDFVTAYKNIPLFWRITATILDEKTKNTDFGVYWHYKDGPVPELKDVIFEITLTKPDGTPAISLTTTPDTGGTLERGGNGWGWSGFGKRDPVSFLSKHGLDFCEPLEFTFITKIPVSVFTFQMENPLISTPEPCRDFARQAFQNIEDPTKSEACDAKLISRDGKPLYCHKMVLLYQRSEALAALLRYPKSEDIKSHEYPMDGMDTATLKAFLEFIYTGQSKITDLPTTAAIIELADAAEQYNFQRLKEACGSVLWKRALEKPEDCFDIVRFADLHDGMKYLKHRGMDILYENWEKFSKESSSKKLRSRFGAGKGSHRLREEYDAYVHQRLGAYYVGPLKKD